MKEIKDEIDQVIKELEEKGIGSKTSLEELETRGIGDVIESTLEKFGITQQRFKEWFDLKECGCTKRKKYLNNILSWEINKKEKNIIKRLLKWMKK
jgi:hypothetical protein